MHTYATAQVLPPSVKHKKWGYFASSGRRTTATLSRDNGLYIFILLVSLKVESIQIKAPLFDKHQSLLKYYPEMPPHPTPQMLETRLQCVSDSNSSLWGVSQGPHCFY